MATLLNQKELELVIALFEELSNRDKLNRFAEEEFAKIGGDEYDVLEEITKKFKSTSGWLEIEKNQTTFVERLQVETREMVDKKVKLQNFLGGKIFPTLIRRKKHLLYKQDRLMSELLEVLGERIELEGSQFKVSDDAIAIDKDGKGLK